MAKPYISAVFITLGMVALYFVIRAAPVQQCDFVHYRDYIGKDGAIEECGVGETAFFDLSQFRYPIKLRLEPTTPIVIGKPATINLSLSNSQGTPITPEDIAISHTQKLHLLLIDTSLEHYNHLHPEPTGTPGQYRFTFTPETVGLHQIYLDFIALRSARRVLASSELVVAPGAVAPSSLPQPVAPQISYLYDSGDVRFRLVPEGDVFRLGEENRFHIEVESTQASSLSFDTVMGAYAHVVAFRDGINGFAHLHPTNPFVSQQDPANPDLGFLFAPTDSGRYRLWAQLHVNGKEHFIPFDLIL